MRTIVLWLALLPGPAWAAEVAWLCDLIVRDSNTPMPAQIVIGHDTETGAVVVNDPVIAQFVGLPMQGRVEGETPRQIVFLWTLQGPADTAHPAIPHVEYRAAISKSDGAVAVRAMVSGSSRPFTASGTCRSEDVAMPRRAP